METKEPDEKEKEEASEEENSFFGRIHGEWVEILAAILLALAVVTSAWSAYQASLWGSEEARKFNDANADRVHASEQADQADQDLGIDTDLFVDYMALHHKGDTTGIEYFENYLFSDELKAAVDAWWATDPFNNPDAPDTPFDMPEYGNTHLDKKNELEQNAQVKSDEAKQAIKHSDNYVMLTVLFASVLFFAGISTKFKAPHLRIIILCIGWILFVGSVVIMFLQPVH
ncbi:MAG: hypothetical protein SWK76_07815 [Actinomycetota bacterium]|nr:hypothetical protein [Actinomycetota bacterium]